MSKELEIQKEKAIAAAEKQVKLGCQLQTEGLRIIQDLQTNDNLAEKAKMLQSAIAAVEKGCTIETKAMQELIKLKEKLS